MPIKDITGQRFGKLVALKLLAKRTKKGEVIWKCKCDCGNIVKVRKSSLRSENGISLKTSSCGCEKGISKIDKTGERFGKLVIVNALKKPDKTGNTIWKCKCDCGKYKSVVNTNLISGWTQSCGCKGSETDSYIKYLLTHKNSLSAKDIPQELVELKRVQLKIHRELKK